MSAADPLRATSGDKNQESTAQRLERLCVAFIATIDNKDFDFASPEGRELASHLSPDWHARLQPYSEESFKTMTLAEQIVHWRQRIVEFPGTHYGIDTVFSHVNETGGVATVLVNMWISGIAISTLYVMNECRWRRNDEGKWIWLSTYGIRGNPMSSGGGGIV